jgi:malic enzyme
VSAHDTNPIGPKTTSQRLAVVTGELKNHKQKCLETAPADLLMLRQLGAATKRIVARIKIAGIIFVLSNPLPERNPNGSVCFQHEPCRQNRAA